MRRLLRIMLYFLVGFYLVFVFVAVFLSDGMIFLPQPSSYRDDAGITKLHTAGGKAISATYLPNPQAKFTILYSHGNAEDIGDLAPLFNELHDAGFAVLGYDYEGYGTSEGKPGEDASYQDIAAAYKFLTDDQHVPPGRIIIFGRSVGNGPAIDLAAREPVGGLIVQSGFTTAFTVLTRVPLVPFERFRNIDKIKKVHCPVLVMHGRKDGVIPFYMGERLFRAAPEPKWAVWAPNAGHNDFEWMARDQYLPAIHDFASRLD